MPIIALQHQPIMKSLYVLCFVVPSCLGFLAHVQKIRDHVSAKLKKPECHVEWEDVTTPHCETYNEQVVAGK